MIYDNGYLYCFYSDDTRDPDTSKGNPGPDQIIVYRRSKDGINWESPVDVCSFAADWTGRPGMPVITKMGNGQFFLVYEYVHSGQDSYIYYKTTSDLSVWDPQDMGTRVEVKSGSKTYYPAAAPSCVWTPAGGTNGTLFVTGQYQVGGLSKSSLFVSRDYGKTWNTMENPLPNDNYSTHVEGYLGGYRSIMVLGKDKSVIHFINATSSTMMKYVTLKVN